MQQKNYSKYESFSYLEKDKDFRQFVLPGKERWAETTHIPLDRREEELLSSVFKDNITISMRDHGFIAPDIEKDILQYCKQLHTIYDYEGLSWSGVDVIFENFMDGIAINSSANGLKWDDVIYNLGIRYADIAKQETVYIATNTNEINLAQERNKIALVPSLEAANIIENEVDRVDILYGFGIRCMGITYNDSNTLGAGLTEENDGGLTNFGKKVIERMNKIGMLIDISHCGDKTSLDVIDTSDSPVLITHAGAREIWNTPRMKSDEVLQACARNGGVIGVCAAPNTTLSNRDPNHHTIDSVIDHIDYLINLVGVEHVGLGLDTFYGDHGAIQHAFDDMLSIDVSHKGTQQTESNYVVGLENPTEATKNIAKYLIKNGHEKDHIVKILGENIYRVLENNLR
ncbi:membrane dipeptidase [Salicibibacter cibarius]|uniref:Membrane dipeptidase n=1 Tax=Salicibibacter cibarius TaxID=2743000 RepID=A0A7T6Z0Z5_9BACI|nr:membrane dipeptidase [Salicibibacter cibarius]QQK74381.1 membrane dipeptidase [Salicibibacter cibarius]